MVEKIDFTVKKPDIDEDIKETIIGVEEHEIESWKEIYPQINIQKTLELIKKLNDLDFKYSKGATEIDEKGKMVPWNGKLSFWGSKRMIMMLFDSDRENNNVFIHLPDEVKSEIRKISIDEYLKN